MIVVWKPGGTIDSKVIQLKPDETLPNKYNVVATEVWRQNPYDGYRPTTLVKAEGQVLPANSKELTNPEFTVEEALAEISPLTEPEKCDTIYEHIDIITVDGESNEGEKE